MTKISSIQMLRGIAALMVVAFHALSIQGKYLPGVELLPEMLEIGQTGVDLFFVISGFVMVLSSHDKRGVEAVGLFLRDRFFRIYPVYWVYFFILLAVYLVVPSIINSSQGGRVELLNSFFLYPSDTLPLLMVAWTLTHEVWFYMVFALILLLPSAFRVFVLFIWFALVIGYTLWGALPSSPAMRVVVHVFTMEFLLGCLAGYIYLRSRQCSSLVLAIVAIFSVSCFWVAIEVDALASALMARATLYGVGYALLLLLLVLCEKKELFGGVMLLKKIGDMSYSLYLSHVLVLSFCGRVWLYFNPVDGVLGGVIFWICTFATTIAAGYLAYVLVERPVLRNTLYRFRGAPVRRPSSPTVRV